MMFEWECARECAGVSAGISKYLGVEDHRGGDLAWELGGKPGGPLLDGVLLGLRGVEEDVVDGWGALGGPATERERGRGRERGRVCVRV